MKSRILLTLLCGLLLSFVKSQTAPVFTGGTLQTLSVCQSSGTNSIDSKMVTTDPDAGQTLTYTIASAPVHGTVHGFPGLTSTGAGGIISPSGFDYAPASGYNGLDSLIVNVSDGTFSGQTKIKITVNALPTVAAITGTASACLGGTSQLGNATTGGVWSSSNVFVADISATGLVTPQAAGTAIISYTITNGTTGCSNAATINFSVGAYPVVQAITGTATVCAGLITQLSSLTSGGVWTSNNNTRATVNASTGLVTGVSAGAVTITYTVTNAAGCSTAVTRNVTVNASPTVSNITATTTTICVGSTTTLTDATNGGTWSSSNTSIATVTNGGPGGGGTVTGVSAGVDTISYTVTNGNGCTNTATVEITVTNGVTVAPITGPTTVCNGKTITLADVTAGGTWSITTGNFRASITQAGVLTATAAGAVVVTYSVTGGGGCSKSVTYNVTVSNAPTLAAITGSNQVCVGTTTTLSNSTAGGTWTSKNTNIATVNVGGVVTGVAAGTDTITYKVINGAGCSDSVAFVITVTSSITVAAIQGGSSVCMGSTLSLTDATLGGVWNSTDLTVAAVNGTGTVIPISQGVVAITYTVGTGACSGIATKNVIVNPSPSVSAISGTTAICQGTTSQLSNTVSGGTWSSSNTNFAAISATGLVTPGNFAGNSTITYTVTNSYGCTSSATVNVTINTRPNVQAITGINTTCVGSTTQLSSQTAGGVWTSANPSVALVPSTSSGLVIGMTADTTTITYTVTNGNGCSTAVTKLVTVASHIVVDSIVGSHKLCLGSTPNPTFTCATTGGTWSSSNTGIATVTTNGGVVTAVATGSVNIQYIVNNGGACTDTSFFAVTVYNRPTQPTINGSGNHSVCVNASITLTSSTTGGYWLSATPSNLSIDSTTGVATGIAVPQFGPATVNVTYTVTNSNGCSRSSQSDPVTINAGPNIGQNTPGNTGSVCVGATLQYTNTTAGGTWSSSNTAVVTIDSTTGLATGISASGGGPNFTSIRYTVKNNTGCASIRSSIITVNTTPTVTAITGQPSVCAGSTTSLYDGTAGGTWSSTNTSIATVSNTGAVTGITAGLDTIKYTVTSGGGGGCAAVAVFPITVNAVPVVAPITGPAGVAGICVNATVQLNDATSGGIWASSNNNRATVSNTGLVTGVGAGAVIISYTVINNGCNTTVFSNGNVYALPVVPAIAGASSVCVGQAITLTNDSTGGVWSVDNTSLATITSNGILTGIAVGSVTVSYTKTNSNGCVKTVTKTISVNALPIITTITGNSPICVGATNTLSNSTTGGTWLSSNTSIATVNSVGAVTGVSAGIVSIRYIVNNLNGCSDSVSVSVTVNALPLVATIGGGNNAVCVGSTTTLTNSTVNGTWSTSNAAVSTINSNGVLTALAVGTTTIKYQVANANSCIDSATLLVTVNALPSVAAITGNTPVCVNATRTLGSSTSGGVWSSNNTAVATVNASGVVAGVSAGTATIKYQITNSSGCIDSATTIITVNALPVVVALTGVNTVCVGLTTTYSSTTSGGVWSSSNPAIASVNAGTISGVAAGSATISYAVTNTDNCTTTVTRAVTVNALPAIGAVTGSTAVCVNSTITLGNTATGGVWTSSSPSVATVNINTGVVTGISAGTTTITYTVSNSNGCISTATATVTVNARPVAAFTVNTPIQCFTGNSFVFTNTSTTPSGSIASQLWSFGDLQTATTTDATHSYGLPMSTYTIQLVVTNSNGCKDSVHHSVTVKANSTSTSSVSICPSELPYSWNGLTFSAAGSQTAHLINSVGCDSAATLNLTIKATSTSTSSLSICESELPYSWNGLTFSAAGSQIAHLINSVGCDSAATLNLTVNANPVLSVINGTTSVCVNSTSSLSNTATGGVWTSSNPAVAAINSTTGLVTGVSAGTSTISYTVTNGNNCSTTATATVTVNARPVAAFTINTPIQCFTGNSFVFTNTSSTPSGSIASQLWSFGDLQTATTTDATHSYGLPMSTYTIQLVVTNSNGCKDSVHHSVTVKANSTSTSSLSICESELPYSWNGLTFSAAGSQTAHLINSVGCDSAATLNLTVKATSTSTTDLAICPSELPYSWNGLTFAGAGSQTYHTTNSVGCDSAATLNLTVKATSTSTTNNAICASELPYSWNGLTFSAAGSQTAHLTNSVGCDSAATLVLTVYANPIVPAINGTTSVCVNATTPLSNTTPNGVWSSNNTAVATIDNTGLVSGLAAGTSTISYVVTNANNCSTTATATVTVNYLPTVASIAGSSSVCIGSTTTLTNTTLGGVWSSLTPFTATVTSGGVVAGVSVGGTTIKYTVTDAITGCVNVANHIITVNALPTVSAITGTNAVCVGATTSLSNNTLNGIWSIGNTAIATIDNSGMVTGVSSGLAVITYTVTDVITGCTNSVSTGVTVNTLPIIGSINGSSSICVNATTTLSSTTNGGTWSSSNTSAATIDNTGFLTAVAAGTTTIKYVVTNASSCTDSVTKTITINALPTVATIAGGNSVCAGSTLNLFNTTSNGVWSSNNTAAATINTTGLVTGIAAGTSTISYTVTDAITGCSNADTLSVVVSTPAVAPITGVNALCTNSSTILSTTTTGGTWSTSDANVATVDANTGDVKAIANGTAAITYTIPVGNACGNSASTLVTVNTTLSVAPITGDSTVCLGNSSTLVSATLGGVWSSSNTAVATIDANTGLVTSVAAGSSTITYEVTSGAGCSNSVTTTYTVNALPSTPDFTLQPSICVGSTVNLVPTISGGVWSSSNTSTVAVDAAGSLTGVSSGNADITYTLTNAASCSSSVTKSTVINALPTVAAIAGNNTVCLGSTITLTNDSTGGVWGSINTAVATIDATTGLVTPVAAGSTTITYTIQSAAGCVTTVSAGITVFDLPTVAPITGGNSVCVGSTITLTDATSGGVWSSVTPFTASVNNGVVTGNTVGGTTIKYTVTDAVTTCVNSATEVVTVNSLPTVPAITGAASVCLNNTTTLSNTTTGGSWSSSNASVATVDNAGVVNGVGAGTATITYIVTNVNGCSKSVTSDITVNLASTSTTDIAICPSELPYTWNGLTFNAAGSQTYHTTNSVGCDSAATLNVTIKAISTSTTDIAICPSELPYTWNGLTFNAAGSQTYHTTNSVGCDSAATLNLTIKAISTSTTDIAICPSELPYTWNGLTFNAAGSQTYHTTNAVGCDSAATLNLTIKAISTSTTDIAVCPSELPYTWNGLTFNAAGSQTYHTTNAVGCDSAATLNLTVKAISTSTTDIAICPSELPYTWNGLTFNAAGSQTYHTTNAVGCDSAATLNLTIKATSTSTTDITICPNALPYSWNGLTFSVAGTQTATLTNAIGCDSLATLNLMVKDTTTSLTTTSSCNSFLWNGQTYTASGTYTWKGTNAAGCDSIATLVLTINTSPAQPIITTSTANVTIPATGVAYGCTTVSGAVAYVWSYTGTGVTIASGQNTENITADFADNATLGDIQVIAVSFNGCNSPTATVSITLPVVISSFTAEKANNTTLVKWTTASEINSKNFEIQRSIDGKLFTTIGSVEAKGNSTITSNYSFVDANPFVGINYYRLKQVDQNGKYTLSAVKQVSFDNGGKFIVNIYPNPVADILNVRLTNGEAKQIRIVSTLGKVLYSTEVIAANGVTQIPVSNLSKGTYFVEVITNNNRAVEKFIKN